MLDQHLWDIYSTCLTDYRVRSLILYEKHDTVTERLEYKFVIFTSNLEYYFKNMDWLRQFGRIFHAERDYQFNQLGNILNCSAVYEMGWSIQIWFVSNEIDFNYLKQKRMRLLIDKDHRFKKERIKLDGIKYGKWYELPDEAELLQVTEKFYTFILKSSRLIQNQNVSEMMKIESEILEPIVINLTQWLTYCDELFTFEELNEIKPLLTLPPVIKELNHSNRLQNYLKVGQRLIDNYSHIMDYKIKNRNIEHLKNCVIIQLDDGLNDNTKDNTGLICLY